MIIILSFRLLLCNVVFLLHLVHDYDKKIGNGTSSGGRHSWAQREKRLSDTFIQDGYDRLVMHDVRYMTDDRAQ